MELLLVLRNRITKSTGTTPFRNQHLTSNPTSSLISGSTRGATFNLPGQTAANDFIVIFFYVNDDSWTLNTPTGYTQLGTQQDNPGNLSVGVYYRQMDGTEGSTVDLTFEGSTNEVIRSRILCIRNAKELVGQVSTSGFVRTNKFESVDLPWSNSRDTYQIAYIAEKSSGDFHNDKLTGSPYNWDHPISGGAVDIFEKTERLSVMAPRDGNNFLWTSNADGNSGYWTQCTIGFRG